jgi:hypothetical protein
LAGKLFSLRGASIMQALLLAPSSRRTILQHCPLPAAVPFEIHGGRNRGCAPGDDYLFQGYRYLYDADRDVLVREDVSQWIAENQ